MESSMARFLHHVTRPNIMKLEPYSSARSISEQSESKLYLDANESPWPGLSDLGSINRYPDPQPRKIKNGLASLYGVSAEQILVGRGADEAIDVLIRCFCEPRKDSILVTSPTYGFYKVCADIQDVEVATCPLKPQDSFSLDIDAIKRILKDGQGCPKLVFLCSPNNPTGNSLSRESMLEVIELFKEKALVVVDEAYIEFSPDPSMVSELSQHNNIVILRTLSKAWGLAGLRFGAAIAHPEVISVMRKVLAPYPLGVPTIKILERVLEPEAIQESCERVETILKNRNWLAENLKSLKLVRKVLPSHTNYITFQVERKKDILAGLDSNGIIIRDRSKDTFLQNFLRVTIGSKPELIRFLEVLESVDNKIVEEKV